MLEKLSGKALSARFKPVGQRLPPTDPATLGPSQAGLVYLDVSAPRRQDLPRELVHRISLSYPEAPLPGVTPASLTETVGRVKVSSRPVPVVAPPLTGPGWISSNGCCSEIKSHRGDTLAVNQKLDIPQRYAIDFEQVDQSGVFYTGAADKLENWAGFGAPVTAVAGGTVVEAVDGLPEQKPLKPPSALPLAEYAGNHVVQKFQQQGHTFYALYAHLKTGSVKALGLRPGQKITAGQKLGLLGNTGNSVAPHLHFHIMATPQPLATENLPYTFTSLTLTARTPSGDALFDALEQGTPIASTPVTPPQTHRNQLPMSVDILTFPTPPPARTTP
ncbi:M23 family metallopeptidase [Streptomyces sp. NPDC096030]|uniref:M23 family metallopeptidase n=1 Tax=Streptomyces sp. NPDC096030 TaxID=3155423 RepID=UPI0033209A88